MSQSSRDAAAQRDVTRIALASVEGFALAGSGAIREHGVTDRPTEDVDLFTANADEDAFSLAVDHVTARLRSSGFEVELTRRAEHFARLHVVTADGVQLDVDLGVDWRQDEPVRLAVGPVQSLDDAVGSKVGALYSRGEVRDYLDVDAIRGSGRFNDEQLLTAAADRDPGFRLDMFLWRLDGARRISPDDVERYGVTAAQRIPNELLVAQERREVTFRGGLEIWPGYECLDDDKPVVLACERDAERYLRAALALPEPEHEPFIDARTDRPSEAADASAPNGPEATP